MSTPADDAKSLLDKYEDAFAALHYMIESFQAVHGIPRGQKDRIVRESTVRTRDIVVGVINELEMEEGGMTIDEVVLHAARKLAEDFLLRVDPILNPDEDEPCSTSKPSS